MGGFAAFIKPLSASDGKRKEIEIGNLLLEIKFTVIQFSFTLAIGVEESTSQKEEVKACSVKSFLVKSKLFTFWMNMGKVTYNISQIHCSLNINT